MKTVDGTILSPLRNYVKKSQTEIGQILNVSQHKISRMEIGKQDLPRDWFNKLVETFEIPETWIKANLVDFQQERDYEMDALKREVEHLKQMLNAKDEIIHILKASNEKTLYTPERSNETS